MHVTRVEVGPTVTSYEVTPAPGVRVNKIIALERDIARSMRAQSIRIQAPIPGKDATKLPTLRDIFYSVEFHEREVFEMFGVYFTGHPDNRRLLLPED